MSDEYQKRIEEIKQAAYDAIEELRVQRVRACQLHKPDIESGTHCMHCGERITPIVWDSWFAVSAYTDEERAVIRDFVIDLRKKRPMTE